MPVTTPAQQAAAAEAARKEGPQPEPVPAPVPEPIAGSKTGLQDSNLNQNRITKVP